MYQCDCIERNATRIIWDAKTNPPTDPANQNPAVDTALLARLCRNLLVDVIFRDTGEQIRAKSTLVPEPQSAVLALSALAGLAWRFRRPKP